MKIQSSTMHSYVKRYGLERATEVWNHVAEQKFAIKGGIDEEGWNVNSNCAAALTSFSIRPKRRRLRTITLPV